MNTLQKIEIYKQIQEELNALAEEYVLEFECSEESFRGITSAELEKNSLGEDVIDIAYGQYYSGCCGGTEDEYVNIPLEYYTNPDLDWRGKEHDARMKRNLEAMKKKKIADDEKKRKVEEAEYKTFIELREKFENKSPKVIVDLSNTIEFADGMDD